MGPKLQARCGNQLHRLLRRLERNEALDPVAERLAGSVLAAGQRSRANDVLSGTWLGHAFHPVLTDFADGAWMACSFLDMFAPTDAAPAAQRLLGFGLLAAVPTALTGLAEWSHSDGPERRVGLVHLSTSMAAFALYGSSYVARRMRKRRAGVLLGVVGGVIAVADGYVGGHLTLALGVGVDRTAFSGFPDEWTATMGFDDLPDRRPTKAFVHGTDVVLVRRADEVFALANRCTYRGGELHGGDLEDDTIVCPRHGCMFRITDGAVLRGPASIPQPAFEVRVNEGRVELRTRAERPWSTDVVSPCRGR